MRNILTPALGLAALLLSGCGTTTTTTTTETTIVTPVGPTPVNPSPTVPDNGGPRPSGYRLGGGGNVGPGQAVLIASFFLSADAARLSGSPVLTFKALNGGGGATLLTASCTLTAPRQVDCRYVVRPGDVGKAARGVQLDSETALSGGGTVGTDNRTAPLIYVFSGGSTTAGGTTF
ncbi:hypothetical protein SAMN04488058_101516 [Deinococcus reticulitermitis]|uniref:Lipoprotein n=1 Tax=Deinococcus reticulitermitis TaxID=856736 RepID=A0A1H6TDX1_9DEIO|nr:hypothetical protein [Deinococcus reticulitermitis]SEI75277.1 hypothetical protein SAMN04488058_101516 [Deinococcus reticulitermitis]